MWILPAPLTTTSIFSISSWTPMSRMPRPYSLCRPSFVCDVAYICQPHATWMIRVTVHDIANSRPRSRLTSAIGYRPSALVSLSRQCSGLSATDCPPIQCYGSQHAILLYILCVHIIDLLYSFSNALNFVHTQNKEIPCFTNKNI